MAALRLTDVSFVYPDGIRALDKVSLAIGAGERIAIVGPNGAGKSTLLRLMAALSIPTEGTIEIMGERLTRKDADRLRRHVGFLFQDPDDQIFMPTVWDDVAFGPINMQLSEEEVKGRVAEAIHLAGIDGYEQRVPHHLSFGEKKRVAIAGVLAMRAPILLLDEPTANLDPQGRKDLIEVLRSLPGTVLIATHDLAVALELTSRVLVLKRTILYDGDFDTLLEEPSVLGRANLELPPLSKLMVEWRNRTGKKFAIPRTVEEALDLLDES
ncbi:MAG: energy-coupling factor ABC transporter ATP-binding protein [Methanomassiliicoccales archaeon]|nr:energy-coupling factor ABC transporter ATP-binding protein [Methanomassiliicoccales archaeon]